MGERGRALRNDTCTRDTGRRASSKRESSAGQTKRSRRVDTFLLDDRPNPGHSLPRSRQHLDSKTAESVQMRSTGARTARHAYVVTTSQTDAVKPGTRLGSLQK